MAQRERLLLTITHDIKAPAASISGFIELLGEYVRDGKAASYLSNIKNSATHLLHLSAHCSTITALRAARWRRAA